MKDILTELQRRKDSKEDPCDDCGGTGGLGNAVCVSCLGQGVLLTGEEYGLLLSFAHREDDSILDQRDFDY
jgi:DnaJ-class molecular chaperone